MVEKLKEEIQELIPAGENKKHPFSMKNLNKKYQMMEHKSYVQVPEEYVKKSKTKTKNNIAEMDCDYDSFSEVQALRDAQPKVFVDPQGVQHEISKEEAE